MKGPERWKSVFQGIFSGSMIASRKWYFDGSNDSSFCETVQHFRHTVGVRLTVVQIIKSLQSLLSVCMLDDTFEDLQTLSSPSPAVYMVQIWLCWLYRLYFPHSGQQSTRRQRSEAVDHRGPWTPTQKTLLLWTVLRWHALRPHYQQTPNWYCLLGWALWVQQPASCPQPPPSPLQRDGQEKTQGTLFW